MDCSSSIANNFALFRVAFVVFGPLSSVGAEAPCSIAIFVRVRGDGLHVSATRQNAKLIGFVFLTHLSPSFLVFFSSSLLLSWLASTHMYTHSSKHTLTHTHTQNEEPSTNSPSSSSVAAVFPPTSSDNLPISSKETLSTSPLPSLFLFLHISSCPQSFSNEQHSY